MARSIFCVGLFAILAAIPSVAQSDFQVTYVQRYNAYDAQSPIRMRVQIDVERYTTQGSTVKWLPLSVSVEHFDVTGEKVNEWLDPSPQVDSWDGLWTVAHSNSNIPKVSDFAASPPFYGVGEALECQQGELEYEFRASVLSPATITAPAGGGIAALNYSFLIGGLPGEEDEDEPVEIPPNMPPID